MFWVDSHCHLQLDGRPPRDLLERAADVSWVVAPGVDAASSRAALELARTHPGRVVAAVGLHPHSADAWSAQRDDIEAMAPAAAAIGEIGLDYYRNLSPRDDQRRALSDQIELATTLDRPIVVHCRDAFADLHEIIESRGAGPRTVLHCWTGGPRWTRRFVELGVTFSFAGPIAFETGDTVRRGAALVPPDRCMVETDTPYLAPPPHRSEPNEPAWVALVGAALARVWGMAEAEVARITSERAAAVFGSPA
jgi:TatD DNase family protein